jgi:hypothetical protein
MSEDGSDKKDEAPPPSERRYDPYLDTQELPRVDNPPGFADIARKDPWNEVTPQELGSEDLPSDARTATTGDLEGGEAEDQYAPDGPVAAPVDAPRPPPKARPPSAARQGFQSAFTAPVVVQRRTRASSQTGATQALVPVGRSGSGVGRAPLARRPSGVQPPDAKLPPERRYPKMRALLRNPDAVPLGIEPRTPKSRAAPVPGTFFPAPKQPKEPPMVPSAPADLDEMLATMAEGLLIGEDAAGNKEVRVTLRDEFFAGTELRIVVGDGKVRAVLVPPDRGTYLMLNGNIDELRMRLESRGLRVAELRVAEP